MYTLACLAILMPDRESEGRSPTHIFPAVNKLTLSLLPAPSFFPLNYLSYFALSCTFLCYARPASFASAVLEFIIVQGK